MCCMMIWHPQDATPFTKAEFADFNRRNPHGFGVIWRQNDRLHYTKGRATLAQQWATYRRLGHRAMALHWRYATAGAQQDANCHPFVVNNVLLMHNGVLQHRSTKTLSDTQCFIRDALADHVSPATLQDERWCAWLDRRIGSGNRMLLWADPAPTPTIIGEKKGMWHKGRWYSNTYAWSAPVKKVKRAKTKYLSWPSATQWPSYADDLNCACGKPIENCWGCYLVKKEDVA